MQFTQLNRVKDAPLLTPQEKIFQAGMEYNTDSDGGVYVPEELLVFLGSKVPRAERLSKIEEIDAKRVNLVFI